MPHLPSIPMGNIPRTAYHKSHGLVRIIDYHGEGRFTVLTKHDSKVTVHRDSLSFRRDRFTKYYSELRRETPQEASARPRRLMQRLRGKQNSPGWMMATEDASPFYFGGYKAGVEPDYTARHVKRFSRNVQKDDRTRRNVSAATGAASGAAFMTTNRASNRLNSAYRTVQGRRYDRLEGARGLDRSGRPVGDVRPAATGQRRPADAPKQVKGHSRRVANAEDIANRKRLEGRRNELARRYKRGLVTSSGRSKIQRVTLPLAVAGGMGGLHYSVDKADRFSRRDTDIAGAAAGTSMLAYQGGGYALKPVDRKHEAKLKSNPEHVARLAAHRQASGLPPNAQAGHEAWGRYFRRYPKGLPGAKLKRTLAYSHAGPTGAALTLGVGGAAGLTAARASRKHRVEKVSDRDRRSGASMTAGGAILGGGGLVAGGIPGAKEPDSSRVWLLRGHKNGKLSPTEALRPSNIRHNARQLAPLPRAGILGFRADMHQAYITENEAKNKGSAYRQGMRRGKLEAEHKIVRGMRTARRAVYPATFAGAGLAYAGHRKMKGEPLRKRDTRGDTASAAAVTAGGGLAAFGHVTPKILDRHSRRYARSAQNHILEAQKLAPHFGGLQERPAKIGAFGEVRRPAKTTIYPTRSDAELRASRAGDRIKGGAEVRAQVGHHRGVAAQERHFVEVFDNTGRHIRRFRGPGLAVAGAGGAGLYAAHEHRSHVRKATEFERGEGYERYAAERSRRRTATSGALWGTAATGAGTGAAAVGNAKLLGTKPGKLALNAAQAHPTAGKVFETELKRAHKIGAHTAAHRGRYTAATLGLSTAAAGAGVMHRFRTQEETGMSQGIGRIKAGETYERQRRAVHKNLVTNAVLASEMDWKNARLLRAARYVRENPLKVAGAGGAVGITGGAVATGVGSKRRIGERTRLKQELGRTGQVAKATYGVQETEHRPAKTGRLLAGVGLLGYGVPRLRMTNKLIGTGRRITETGAKRAQVATGAGAVLTATGLPRNKHHFTPVQAQPVYG